MKDLGGKACERWPGCIGPRAEELRGGLMAAAAADRERRAALSSALCDSDGPEGTAWSCARGGQLRAGDRGCTRGW